MCDSIGGYFELELNSGAEYHTECVGLNSARNCLEYIISKRRYKKVFLPYYTCEVLFSAFTRTGVEVEQYYIDSFMRPIFDYTTIGPRDCFIYTNYFGLFTENVKNLVHQKVRNLVIDNAQAFFEKPIGAEDTFNSPRKFFGVPDGGYVYMDGIYPEPLRLDVSVDRVSHLVGRIDLDAESCFAAYRYNNAQLINLPIRSMSKLSRRILSSINYDYVKVRRSQNFQYLHNRLSNHNMFYIPDLKTNIPLVYPFWVEESAEIYRRLSVNKIYCAKYWPNVLEWVDEGIFEHFLARDVIFIPIDQRYGRADMDRILKLINL